MALVSKNPYDKIMKLLGLAQCLVKLHRLTKTITSNVRYCPSFSPFKHLKALDRYVEGK